MKQVFVSYAHEDASWKEKVVTTLKLGEINSVWVDTDLRTGSDWESEIDAKISNARVAILILSPNFFQSDYIINKELPALKERRGLPSQPLAIFPLLVRMVDQPLPVKFLASIQRRPSGNRALEDLGKIDQMKQLTELFSEVEVLVNEDSSPKNTLFLEPPQLSRMPTLELSIKHRKRERYRVDFSYRDTGGKKLDDEFSYVITLQDHLLCALPEDCYQYGNQVLRALFPAGKPQQKFRNIVNQARQFKVRFRINVDHLTSRDLSFIHWETILGGSLDPNTPIPSFLFSRFVSAGGDVWQKPELRSWPYEASIEAIVFDADDNTIASQFSNDLIKYLENTGYQFLSKQGSAVSVMSDSGKHSISILTLNTQWIDTSGNQVSIETVDEDGKPKLMAMEELAYKIGNLRIKPQLIILQSPEQNYLDKQEQDYGPRLLTLAMSLIETGVCAVLTTQAQMEASDWTILLSDFLTVLKKKGNIDQALDYARRNIRVKSDRWKLVLLTRLRTGQIWYMPDFVGHDQSFWGQLSSKIIKGKCIPVLGPNVSRYFINMRSEIAKRWARNSQYPMEAYETRNLRKVAQYVATMHSRDTALSQFDDAVNKYFRELRGDDRISNIDQTDLSTCIWDEIQKKDEDYNYNILAKVGAPIYLTTSYVKLLSLAINRYLNPENKSRDSETRDRIFTRREGIMFDEGDHDERNTKLSKESPFIYYLFGRLDYNHKTLVLTEDDHFTFLLRFLENWNTLPKIVNNAFSDSALLFLGFNLESWDFRTLFQAFLNLEGSDLLKEIPHVAVQLEPDDERVRDPERTRDYLVKYFGTISNNPQVYMGSVEDFLKHLSLEMDKARAQQNQG